MRVEYELIHDSLVSPILQWLGDDFWMAQQVCELLRLTLPAWRERQRLLLLEDLRLVHEHRQLVNLTAEELGLLYATAVAYNEPVADWQAQLSPAVRLAVLRQLLKHNEAPVRRQAVLALAEFARPHVAARLAQLALQDDDTPVRSAAADSLAAIANQNPRAVSSALTKLVAQVAQPVHAERATSVLVQVRDQAPVVHTQLPGQLRWSIRWQVWVRRWRRNQSVIGASLLRGLQAGFWGLGLGMGPLFAVPAELINVAPRTLAALIFTGVALAGMIGGLVMGGAVFMRTALQTLQDHDLPWRTWAVTSLVGGGLMAPTFVMLNWVNGANSTSSHSALAGLLIGTTLVGMALLPGLPTLSIKVGVATLAGILIFALCRELGWFAAERNWGWIVLVGGPAGYGFALGFARGSPVGTVQTGVR